jgi:hypothetical protein
MDGDETKAACYAEFHLDYAIERIDLSDQKKNNFNIKQVFCGKRTNFFFSNQRPVIRLKLLPKLTITVYYPGF